MNKDSKLRLMAHALFSFFLAIYVHVYNEIGLAVNRQAGSRPLPAVLEIAIKFQPVVYLLPLAMILMGVKSIKRNEWSWAVDAIFLATLGVCLAHILFWKMHEIRV